MSKSKKRGSVSHVAKKSAPSNFNVTVSIAIGNGTLEYIKESQLVERLPCTLADLAADVAETAFTLCEELAFKAGIKFLPAKEIKTDAS